MYAAQVLFSDRVCPRFMCAMRASACTNLNLVSTVARPFNSIERLLAACGAAAEQMVGYFIENTKHHPAACARDQVGSSAPIPFAPYGKVDIEVVDCLGEANEIGGAAQAIWRIQPL